MSAPPYRIAAPRPPDPSPPPADEATRLGVLRSVHTARSSWLWLILAVALAVLFGYGVALSAAGPSGVEQSVFMIILLVVETALLVIAAAGAQRVRGLRIELYAGGVTLVRARSRRVVLFEDVDEVWLSFARVSVHTSIDELRIVDREGATHRVPMQVTDAPMLSSWIVQCCSAPLLADARAALNAGEALTFGRVRFDRDAITFGRARVKWSDFRLVRFLPGRIAFFRRMPVFPWRTLKLDAVPHPTIFVTLVKECARAARAIDIGEV